MKEDESEKLSKSAHNSSKGLLLLHYIFTVFLLRLGADTSFHIIGIIALWEQRANA